MKVVANNVTVIVIKDAGHWTLEEKPTDTINTLVKFL
jgi:pimeloyl-ACP methyl ester carboxylesterase